MNRRLPSRRTIPLALAGVAAFAVGRWLPVGQGPPPEPAPASGSRPVAPENQVGGQAGLPASADPPTVPVGEQFWEAIWGEKDSFRAADKMFTAIEHLTAADFTKMLEQPDARRKLRDALSESPFSDAAMQAFVKRWLAVDPAGAMASLANLSVKKDSDQWWDFRSLRQVLAELRPAEFLAATRDAKKDDGARSVALRALGRTQPEAARRMVEAWPEKDRQDALQDMLHGMAESDPLTAVRMARGAMKKPTDVFATAVHAAERVGPGMLRQVLEAGDPQWFDPGVLPLLYARNPGLATDIGFPKYFRGSGSAALTAFLTALPAQELQRRLAEREKLPAPIRDVLTEEMAGAWAVREPRQAIAWAMEQQQDRYPHPALTGAFSSWQKSDPAGAAEWWDALPESPVKQALGRGTAAETAERGDVEQAMRMFALDPILSKIPASAAYLGHLGAQRDPAKTAPWLTNIPETEIMRAPMREAMRGWFERDPAAVSTWAAGLPRETRWRDEAAGNLARLNVFADPAAAAQWAGAIEEPTRREDVVTWLFGAYSGSNPAQARTWLREVPGLPAELHEKLQPWLKKRKP